MIGARLFTRRLFTRRLFALGAAGSVAGCGFHPLYMPQGGKLGPVSSALAAIYVPVIPERSGQLLRQALQRRLEGSGTGIAKRYELVASMAVAGEGIAIQRDTSTSRIRLIGTSTWSLRELNLAHTVLISGNVRVLDGYNIINQQFFAADLEQEAATKRLAETMSDQMILKLGTYFNNPATAPKTAAPLPEPPSIPAATAIYD